MADMPKAYEAHTVEPQWRERWEQDKTFKANAHAGGTPYCIVIPPPNVTGVLHIGHALNVTLIDVLCRFHRQLGKNVLWIPGTDHAGIATQNVVERALAKEGITRQDLGREAFIAKVWEWREDYGHRILDQIRALGASVDWSRLRFTMDDNLARAVRKVFVDLYRQNLIYKGDYIINWCARCHTALADDEVEHNPTKGRLWHIRYHLSDGTGSVTIATTRPETILGDTAVCVHPDDERYAHLIGKTVLVPVIQRKASIIADTYVDREFGTGALKVTPSHDHNDWQLGKRHNLEFIQAIDDNGLMKDVAGPYTGLTKEECRKRIVADIEIAGDLEKTEDIEHAVGRCYRCDTVVEPHVSTQWFVAATKLAENARKAVPHSTRVLPETWLKTYYHWLDNIRDWCISRQIWWGHRIPAWTCAVCGELIVAEETPPLCPACAASQLIQDEDVLDTWFSSALWPFSTLGWPEQTLNQTGDQAGDLKTWYPTAVLVTGFDILFFWVARMMMLGIHCMGRVPFHDVYLHALVRDAQGRKMSKSLGNAINPIEMIDKYGCDALRFTLTSLAAMGRDIRLSEERIEGYRHFINKLWNAARFALMNLPEMEPLPVATKNGLLAPEEIVSKTSYLHHQWILHRLEDFKTTMKDALENYRFNDAAQCGYRFLWSDFCDWYLEFIKHDMSRIEGNEYPKNTLDSTAVSWVGVLNILDKNTQDNGQVFEEQQWMTGRWEKVIAQYVLFTVLREMLILLHPMIPFVTAEIWQALPGGAGQDLAREPYPAMRPVCNKPEKAADMEWIQGVIVAIRTIRAELNIAPSLRLKVFLRPATEQQKALLWATSTQVYIQTLARLEKYTLLENMGADIPKASASNVVQGCEIIVPLSGAVNLTAELARLDKEMAKLDKELHTLGMKLANESFVKRAPADVVQRERERAESMRDARAKLEALRERFAEALEE